ncbi:MAG: glutamate--cysteine ligase [Gammaproteobacteria bacterium]|nr:glutamate--cysteine ligase [Gammaproteobacteria bacterium]
MTDPAPALPLFAGYGIELEYMTVQREDLSVMPVVDQLMKEVAGEYVSDIEDGPIAWSNELVLHVLELKTNGPVSSLMQLPDLFLTEIHHINSILETMNGRLMPTSMHPWMDPSLETRLWVHDTSEIYDAFHRIFNCQGHGWSNLQSMHINLPFADDREFALLHTAIRLLLPVMPALAASSPIMEGSLTGLMDTRLETYRHNASRLPPITGLVIPEAVLNQQQYQDEILQPMYAAIAPYDKEGTLQYEWLNSRGAITRFERNTIEIRILDTQETPVADIAIAAAIIGVLKHLIAGAWTETQKQTGISTEALAEIFLDVIKNAEQAVIDNRDYLAMFAFPDRRCNAQELWHYFLESVTFDGADKNHHLQSTIQFIQKHGPLARRITNAVGTNCKRSQLEETYRTLCACLDTGQMFEGID